MKRIIIEKLKESAKSILPVSAIVVLLHLIAPMPLSTLMLFLAGSVLLILG